MVLVILLSFSTVLFSNTYVVSGIGVSEKKCDDYRKMLPPMPKDFNENDEEVAPKEFPFMANVHNATHFTNGILISENFVLSTAFASNFYSDMFVVLGDLETGTNENNPRLQTYNVIDTFVHSNFNLNYQSSDIKLLKLNQSVRFDEYVRPACLSPYTFSISKQLIEIGWSSTNVCNSSHLHKVKLNYISNESCKEIYKSNGHAELTSGIDNATIFCAGAKKGDREMCAGFAGSALINADRKAFNEIVGIASFSFGCGGWYPKLFVQVSAYIDWIERTVWPDEEILNGRTSTTVTSPTTVITSVKPNTNDTGTKSFKLEYILIVSAIVLTLICTSIVILFKMVRSRNHQNTMNVHLHMAGNNQELMIQGKPTNT